jgi:hypothetical protein
MVGLVEMQVHGSITVRTAAALLLAPLSNHCRTHHTVPDNMFE